MQRRSTSWSGRMSERSERSWLSPGARAPPSAARYRREPVRIMRMDGLGPPGPAGAPRGAHGHAGGRGGQAAGAVRAGFRPRRLGVRRALAGARRRARLPGPRGEPARARRQRRRARRHAAGVRPRRGPGGRRPAAPGGAGRPRRRRARRGARAGPLPGPGRRAGRAGVRRLGDAGRGAAPATRSARCRPCSAGGCGWAAVSCSAGRCRRRRPRRTSVAWAGPRRGPSGSC